jgi:CDP-glycerol glycerophosphotransferase
MQRIRRRLDSDLDLVVFDHAHVYDDGRVFGSRATRALSGAPKRPFTIDEWPQIVNLMHVPWNKVVRRQLLTDHGIKFPHSLYEDVVFTYRTLLAATSIVIEPSVCYAYRRDRPGALTRTCGLQHLSWIDSWRAVLDAAETASPCVRTALYERMWDSGWRVLAQRHRLRGPHRREFFDGFAALYGDYKRPDLPCNPVLASGSWALGRARLLPRRVTRRLLGAT